MVIQPLQGVCLHLYLSEFFWAGPVSLHMRVTLNEKPFDIETMAQPFF